MKLVIKNCSDLGFILYLIKFLRQYIINTASNKQLVRFDTYFKKIELDVSAKYIVVLGARYLQYKKFASGTYEIYINHNVKIKDYKLISLCKLINYGSLSVIDYPIFTDAFDYVSEHIEVLHYKYTRGF